MASGNSRAGVWQGIVVAVLVAVACGQPAVGHAYDMNLSISGMRLGGQITGPAVGPQAVRSRVTALVFWAVSCHACDRELPLLEEQFKKLGPSGFVVIGAVRGKPGAPDAKKKAGELGLTFAIVDDAEVANGMDFQGTPHCIVFDHTGRCVFRGLPAEATPSIEAAVRIAPAAALAGEKFTKLASLASQSGDDAGLAVALRKLKGMTASKDADMAEEATRAKEKLEKFGRVLLDEGIAAKTTDPVRAGQLVQRCATAFKGTDIGTEATALQRDWKKDRAYQNALQAAQQFVQLQAMRRSLLASLGGPDAAMATPEILARMPPAAKQQMAGMVAGVKQNLPGSTFASQADDIALEFGLDQQAKP